MMNAQPDLDAAKDALKHFATAICFLIVGLAALVWNSGRLATEDFSDLRVIGGLHFITLGWLSLSVFGVLRVFSGVSLGAQGFIRPLGTWVRYLWTLGTLTFPAGLIHEIPALIASGASLLGLALLLFTIHFVPAIKMAREGVTKWFLAIALLSLWGTWFLGLLAALVRSNVSWSHLPPGYFSAHVLFAVFGWMGATAVGVGSVLIPMFAYSKGHTELPLKIALGVWCLIPLFAGLGAYLEDPYLTIGWTLAGIGSALWVLQVILYLRARLSKKFDPGMMLAGGSTLLLGIAWVVYLITDGTISFLGLVLVGWLTLFTLGIYHRTLPFLSWFLLISKPMKGRMPKVEDLINPKIARVTEVTGLIGAVLWGTALFVQLSPLAYVGSALILVAALTSLFQIKFLVRK